MLTTTQIGLCIKSNEGKICSLAREREDKMLIFDSTTETTTNQKKVALFSSEKTAKNCLVARSKYGIYLTPIVFEILKAEIPEINSLKTDNLLDEYIKIKYNDIKKYIKPCEIMIKYNLI